MLWFALSQCYHKCWEAQGSTRPEHRLSSGQNCTIVRATWFQPVTVICYTMKSEMLLIFFFFSLLKVVGGKRAVIWWWWCSGGRGNGGGFSWLYITQNDIRLLSLVTRRKVVLLCVCVCVYARVHKFLVRLSSDISDGFIIHRVNMTIVQMLRKKK